ncbi:MAG: DUF4296 domain-containing protein [Bacteroidales bacterium]|nr:DUF4296 domain-containing protein [Bacteroidales bacterium]
MMSRTVGHILVVLAAVLALSSCRGPKRISRSEMKDIYFDMFMADQHIKDDRDLKRQADTMLVYEGVFRAHGYDTDDYLYSVSYYLRDPERFAKMMKEVSDRLDREAQRVGRAIEHEDWVSKFMGIRRMPVDSVLLPFSPDSLYVGAARMERDSLDFFYRLVGLRKDSTAVFPAAADTLPVSRDSLPAGADSVVMVHDQPHPEPDSPDVPRRSRNKPDTLDLVSVPLEMMPHE